MTEETIEVEKWQIYGRRLPDIGHDIHRDGTERDTGKDGEGGKWTNRRKPGEA